MKESIDNEDPLPRKRSGRLFPASFTFLFSFSISPEFTTNFTFDLPLILFLLFLSLFFSGLRAGYSILDALENPWDRKSELSDFYPNELQQLTLSVIQRVVTLLGLIFASKLIWEVYDSFADPEIYWVAAGCLIFWLWLDGVTRFLVAKNAVIFIKKLEVVSKLIFIITSPLCAPILKLSYFLGLKEKEGTGISLERLESKSDNEEETELLRGLANFRQTNARKAMQARVNITAFDIELNFHELMDKINKSGYSRVPVFQDDLDHITGILNVKDLLPHISHDEHFNWQKLIRNGYFIPESKRLDDLMKEFQNRRVHMAIVVDEYGGTSGVITLEDIIEEIFGDINDEYDDANAIHYTQVDANTFVFEGKVEISDLCRILNIEQNYFDEVRGNNESLAGLLLELFSRLPLTGEITTHDNITFKVQSADKRKIKKVRILVG